MVKKISGYFTLSVLFLLFFATSVRAQFPSPVKWQVSAVAIEPDVYEIRFHAKMDPGFTIYSHDLPDDIGPVPTSIIINKSSDIELISKVGFTGKKEVSYDEIFQAELAKFKKEVTFSQRVKLLKDKVTVSGSYEAQACNEHTCYPPDGADFQLQLTRKPVPREDTLGIGKAGTDSVAEERILAEEVRIEGVEDTLRSGIAFNWQHTNKTCVQDHEAGGGGIWLVFVLGFLGGLIALLTPCVFPMIPLTVSYFTKGGKDKGQGVKQASLYGISIILIYVLLGLAITLIFGADALNILSTSAFFNLLFFVIFILFALSFFGLFEITLPASWANKTDQLSGKGGFIGIFFMAFTLALVSFSCTGPIIGSLLVQAATDQGPSIGVFKVKPIMGMLGFSLALALPFTLFALFPQWLKSLPKSGGWLGKVKVILGLLELAFAFKFLSVVDLTQNWGILRWELFMGIWVVLFMITGFYAIGIFSRTATPKVIKAFGLACIFFALYLIKATVTYTPVALLSGLAPSTHYNFFNPAVHEIADTRDFEEALALAKEQGKPVMIDFTGFGCVNCREMEEQVWTDPVVQKLMDEFVIVSLYVDDRAPLPESEQYVSAASGKLKKIRTVGNKWTDFEIRHFKKASQPYYVLIDTGMNVLTNPVGYVDKEEYTAFLKCGLEEFKRNH